MRIRFTVPRRIRSFILTSLGTAVVVGCLLPVPAVAREVEPGEIRLSGGLGPTVRMPSKLGADGGEAYFNLAAGAAYAIDRRLSVIGRLQLGIGRSNPLRVQLGGQYRFISPALPLTPYVEAHLLVGSLFGVLGANLPLLGVGGALGADYDLSANFALGLALNADFTTSLSRRGAFYGVVDILFYATLSL